MTIHKGLKIDIYSHHFQVSNVTAYYRNPIEQFASRLVEIAITADAFGNYTREAIRTYAQRSIFDDLYVYRFHINMYADFKEFMWQKGITLEFVTTHPLYEPGNYKFEMQDGWEPFEVQKPVIDYMVAPGVKKVVDSSTGSGKGLLNGTPVRGIDGWINIEDLKVGDKVMGETGEFHKVTGVYPQGDDLDLYEFTFADGRNIVTDISHLWKVTIGGNVSIISTKELFEVYKTDFDISHIITIPLINNTYSGLNVTLPVDPYLLGLSIDDNGFNNIPVETTIPDIYLTASVQQRYALASGLLDKCGKIDFGCINYQTSTKTLSDSVKELFYSLGCMVEVTVNSKGYNLRIVVKHPQKFFRLSENKIKAGELLNFLPDLELLIRNVRLLPNKGSTTCISVDNPTKLFVTKDYIVTHNTAMSMFAFSRINQRVALVIKPMYIERWLDELVPGPKQSLKGFTNKDVVVVRGGAALRSIIYMAQENELKQKFIIISNRTLSLYYEDYNDNGPTEEYGFVKPEELWEVLDVGVRLIDEAHQHFYACFVCDLNSHVPKSIELSGTLEPDQPFLKKMYNVMYPVALRLGTGKRDKYIQLIALNYQLDDHPKPVGTTRRGRSSYSQAAYEENILKQPKRKQALKVMIADVVASWFMKEKLPDYKLLLFFDTVDACATIADYLSELHPTLKVSKYTQEESASVLDDCDIIVATPGSAGTAVDIKNLQMVISFVMRSSSQALIQYIGRLRTLKTDKVKPKYIYLYTRDITTHQKYDLKMQDVYKNIVETSERMILNHTL